MLYIYTDSNLIYPISHNTNDKHYHKSEASRHNIYSCGIHGPMLENDYMVLYVIIQNVFCEEFEIPKLKSQIYIKFETTCEAFVGFFHEHLSYAQWGILNSPLRGGLITQPQKSFPNPHNDKSNGENLYCSENDKKIKMSNCSYGDNLLHN